MVEQRPNNAKGIRVVEDLIRAFRNMFAQADVIDLSHTLDEDMPVWPTHPHYHHNLVESYVFGDVSCHYQLTLGEHTGTHIDAPLHFVREGPLHYGVDQIPLGAMCGRAATISATKLGEKGLLTRDHVVSWERENGDLEPGDIVLLRFGWDKFWAKRPNERKFLANWPGVAKDAAEYFVEKMVKLVGSDTLALDVFNTTDHPTHNVLLGHEVLIVENLNNLDRLPPFSFFIGFPLKISNGSGSPIRAVAFVPKAGPSS